MQIHLHSCHYLLKQLVVYLIRPHNQRMTLLGNSPPSLGGTNRSSGCTFWEIILLREEAQLEVPLLSLKCHQDDYHHCSFLHVYIYFEHMGQNEYNLNRMAIATKYSFWLYVNYRSYQKNPKTRKIFHYETHNNMQCLRDKLKVVGCPAFFFTCHLDEERFKVC